MKAKKIASLVLTLLLSLSLFAGCASEKAVSSVADISSAAEAVSSAAVEPESVVEPADMNVASLKGPTTMGMVKLMQDSENGLAHNNYTFSMAGAPDEIVPQLVKGEVDIALVPANLAAVLYKKTEGNIQVSAVNTLGVLYVLENGDSIQSVADLEGKTIYSPGKGATPEYVLRYVLEQNNVNCNIEFLSEATEAAAKFESEENCIVMLPQPYATAVGVQNENVRVALDMTEEWNKVSENPMVTGVVVARKDFIEANPAAFEVFMNEYAASTEWVNANPDEAAALIVSYGIVPKEPIAKKALPACNITCITGSEMKDAMVGYLTVLFNAEPKSVGGAMPADDFYYGA